MFQEATAPTTKEKKERHPDGPMHKRKARKKWSFFRISFFSLLGRGEKTPTPKTRFSIWTLLRTPGRFTTRSLPVYFTTKMSVVRPFSVLGKDEIGP